jgi:uncharacterized protein (DUF58 family)
MFSMQESRENNVSSIFSVGPAQIIGFIILFFALVRADFGLALPAAGLLLISFATSFWSRFAVRRLEFNMTSDRDRVFPGENLVLTVELKNLKILPVWVLLELPSPPHLAAEDGDALRGQTRLLPWEKSLRAWRLSAKRRGVSSLGPARISAGDLLGLCSRTKIYSYPREIIVFPRRLRLKTLDIPFQEYFGVHVSRGPVEDPAWYAGTRDYTGSRPAKNIHWKASARLGVLQEKLYEPTLHRKVLFIFDAEGYAPEQKALIPGGPPPEAENQGAGPESIFDASHEDFERMIETLATLAAALMETGASFGLVTNAPLKGGKPQILSWGRGPEHLGSLLEMLARITPGENTGLGGLCREASAGHSGGLVYCGAVPGDRARDLRRNIPGRGKIFFVFSGPGSAQSGFADLSWEGFPARLAGEIAGE